MSVRTRRDSKAHLWLADIADIRFPEWAISANIRLDRLPDDGERFCILSKGGLDATTRANYYLGYENDSGTYQLIVGFVTAAGAVHTFTAEINIPVGEWYAVAGSYDAADLRLYAVARGTPLDPEAPTAYTLSESTAETATAFENTEDLLIGASIDSAGTVTDGFDGCITELALYDAAISEATLEGRLGQRLTGRESNAILYLRLDEGLGGYTPLLNNIPTAFDRIPGQFNNPWLFSGVSWADDPIDLFYDTGDFLDGGFIAAASASMRPETVITADSADPDYPASNLYNPRQEIYWQSPLLTTSVVFVFDFGAPVPIWLFSAHNLNWSSVSDITLELNSADSWGSPAVSETVTFHPERLIHIFSRPYQYRYARLTVDDAGTSQKRLGAAHFWTALEILRAPLLDDESYQLTDSTTYTDIPHAMSIARSRQAGMTYALSLTDLRRAWANQIREALRKAGGGTQPVLLCTDPKRALYPRSFYGFARSLGTETIADPAWELTDLNDMAFENDRA